MFFYFRALGHIEAELRVAKYFGTDRVKGFHVSLGLYFKISFRSIIETFIKKIETGAISNKQFCKDFKILNIFFRMAVI